MCVCVCVADRDEMNDNKELEKKDIFSATVQVSTVEIHLKTSVYFREAESRLILPRMGSTSHECCCYPIKTAHGIGASAKITV